MIRITLDVWRPLQVRLAPWNIFPDTSACLKWLVVDLVELSQAFAPMIDSSSVMMYLPLSLPLYPVPGAERK